VPGEPITEFCDRHNYTTRQRLELFMQACDGIQHAHHKAIIHRDIKPNNLLVMLDGGKPLVKVIDFGVAKATAQRLTERTVFTAHGQLIGTPEYMSPEQAAMNALDVDTRTDIYSLGVVLYELLSGTLPFDGETLRRAALDEIRRVIRESEPRKPSTRLRDLGEKLPEVARHRHTDPDGLRRLVRGDLDWIVMKCLEKEPRRRYETPEALTQDVARYLAHRPVVAGQPGRAYRLRKFVRRNRLGVAVGTLIALSLTISFVMLLMALKQTQRGYRQVTDLLQSIDPDGEYRQRAAQIKREAEESQRLKLQTLFSLTDRELTCRAEFCPLDDTLAVIRRDGRVALYDKLGQPAGEIALPGSQITTIAFAPNSGRLLVGTRKGAVLLFESLTQQPREIFRRPYPIDRFVWLGSTGRALVLSALRQQVTDEKTRELSDANGEVFDVAGGQTLWKLTAWQHLDYQNVSASPDGSWLAVLKILKERGCYRLNAATGAVEGEMINGTESPLSVAIAPDGRRLAVGTPGIKLCDSTNLEPVRYLEGHTNWVVALTYSADGQRLISGAGDSTARIWQLSSGTEIGRIRVEGSSSYIQSVGFSRDGTRAFAAADYQLVVAKTP
jgi:hypothetical protein